MSYPPMPQYGQKHQQQYAQSSHESYQHQQYSGQPLGHSMSQQQYYTSTPQRPVVPQQYQSWSAPPPPYLQQDLSSVYPPPPPPRPTPRPGYSSELGVPNAYSQHSSTPQTPSPIGRPVSPLPASEAEYRGRLEAAGVTQQQIAIILGQQTVPQDTSASNLINPPTGALQNLSLSSDTRADSLSSRPFPFNLSKSAPIVLHDMDAPGDDDSFFYLVPANVSQSSRLYTGEWSNIPDKFRPGLRLRHHKDQDTAYSREAGSCTFSAKYMMLKFPWLEWGEWGQASGMRTQHFDSDTGILNKQVMYWEKDTAGYHGKPTVFILRCKVTNQGLDEEQKPKVDDRVIVTVDVRRDGEPDIITIAPGVVETQDQLDEIVVLTLAVKQKFHLDMAIWLGDAKNINMDDLSKFDDLSMVPEDVDGFGGEHGENLTNSAQAKAAKKARWKERAKIFGSSAKLAGQVGQLSMNIAAMNSGQ